MVTPTNTNPIINSVTTNVGNITNTVVINSNTLQFVPIGVEHMSYNDSGSILPDFGNYIKHNVSSASKYIAPIPIVPLDSNYYGTVYEDSTLNLLITSNIVGASIVVNDANIFQVTPQSINLAFSDLIYPTITKTVTIEKHGYVSTEKYIVSIGQNPNYNWSNHPTTYKNDNTLFDTVKNAVNSFDNTIDSVGFKKIYTTVKPYIVNIKYYNNGIELPFTNTSDPKETSATLNFNLLQVIVPPPPVDITRTLNFTVDTANAVTIVKNNTDKIALVSGSNSIVANLNDVYSISSSDLTLYRIITLSIHPDSKPIQLYTALPAESLSTSIKVDSVYTVTIITEAIPAPVTIILPTISLANPSTVRNYNINSTASVPIAFAKSSSVTKLKVSVNGFYYEFNNLGTGSYCGIVIPVEAFNNVGKCTIHTICADTDGNDGNAIDVVYNVIQEYYVGIPDIFNITYPSEILGPDYIGTDVDFTIQWNSANTDYIRLYSGVNYIQLPAIGNQVLNIKTLLDMGNTNYSENDTELSFQLSLIPYNISGNTDTVGREEIITIKFIKGINVIPRPVAVNRIAEAFALQFDTIEVDDEGSKYLTHLLHLGDGNNKVITTWTGSNDSVILKLYEPLPTAIDTNQLVWISKLQSTSIIETVTLIGTSGEYCTPLKGPNYSIDTDNSIGVGVFDDLMARGYATSTDLINKYSEKIGIDTEKLNIVFVDDSNYLFENFVNFSSAEERVNNFYYKLQLIENYQTQYNYVTSSLAISATLNASSSFNSINLVKQGFDSFENFLYTNTVSSLSYPKINEVPILSTTDDALNWYDQIIATASLFDKWNPNYLANNFPQYVKEDTQNSEFVLFTDMIGQHFDIIWSYINAMNKNKQVEAIKSEGGIINDMVFNMLESMGWNGKVAYNSEYLWHHAFGLNQDGTPLYSTPLVTANEEIWRRILYNLPYLLKHKGTSRALKAAMACYGVPQSMLTIMEFGGPNNPSTNATTKFTFDDRTCALHLDTSSNISIPWKTVPTKTDYPNCIELRIKPDSVKNCTLVSGDSFSLNLQTTTGSLVYLKFLLGNEFGGTVINSPSFSLSTDNYSHIVINQTDGGPGLAVYDVYLKTTDGHRIVASTEATLPHGTSQWMAGSSITVGGSNFSGEIDEVRLWTVPLHPSKIENHTLFPDAINGNSYTASTSDLMFRLDFEYPKNRIIDPYIKNVAISTLYAEPYATASINYSAPSYPYGYVPYDRVVTANVPSVGFSSANKIRFEDQELIGDLSYKVRATKKSYDRSPIDSSRLGIFFSPTKELNLDILKAFGDFNIDDYIGNPADEYSNKYSDLDTLRTYYFERLNRDINEYIQLVRYVDKSLFDVLVDLSPARAKLSKGLLIEPHYLERNKTAWKKVESQRGDHTTSIDITEHTDIIASNETQLGLLDATEIATLDFKIDNYEGIISSVDTFQLNADPSSYNTQIDYSITDLIKADVPVYDSLISVPLGATVTGEFESVAITYVGMDANSLANAGFGLYANTGVGKVTEMDIFGNVTSSRQNIYLVKEEYQINIPTQIAGYPTLGAMPGDQVVYADVPVTKYRYNVVKIPFSGSITLGNGIVGVTALNGYFPTHHRYVSNLSEGLKRSLYKGSVQTAATTPDGLPAVETFTTNPNILRVANTGRGSGEPILIVS